jgi:hypothetical protein
MATRSGLPDYKEEGEMPDYAKVYRREVLCRLKAKQIWDGMDENERTAVRIGMFPAGKMQAAEAEGYNGKDLSVALMEVAKNNGGMIA